MWPALRAQDVDDNSVPDRMKARPFPPFTVRSRASRNVLRYCSPLAVRWVRLSRGKVCTAVIPESFLSTYIAESSG